MEEWLRVAAIAKLFNRVPYRIYQLINEDRVAYKRDSSNIIVVSVASMRNYVSNRWVRESPSGIPDTYTARELSTATSIPIKSVYYLVRRTPGIKTLANTPRLYNVPNHILVHLRDKYGRYNEA